MFALRKIRDQMYFGVILLSVIVVSISLTSLQGAWKFRNLTKSMRERSLELPEVAQLGQRVSELRSVLWQLYHQAPAEYAINSVDRGDFSKQLDRVEAALDSYHLQLDHSQSRDPWITDRESESEFIEDFRSRLRRIRQIIEEDEPTDWVFHKDQMYNPLETELSELQRLTAEIPVVMQRRMTTFADRSRTEYKAWIWITLGFTGGAALTIGLLIVRFRMRIILPLQTLVAGSREVARGNYDHRTQLDSEDEVKELAEALNCMTANFQAIQADLNRQVQARTKEVVRSEKMASVGFLAAGVAHEINNPLASIAWSAESLESRVHDILADVAPVASESARAEIEEMQRYLQRIQQEAFRVKEITGSLLDFARMGDVQKKPTNLVQVIESVIDIVKPLSKYRSRNLVFRSDRAVIGVVNEQEMKQVTLNLITNALGSVAEGGTVEIDLRSDEESTTLTISDDGCGMDEEVRKHLFEPFFTRRRDGQGTGLGLSITYQIIEEHGGRIMAQSDGVGTGSTFTVILPRVNHESPLAA